jgi:hypothetical protein
MNGKQKIWESFEVTISSQTKLPSFLDFCFKQFKYMIE